MISNALGEKLQPENEEIRIAISSETPNVERSPQLLGKRKSSSKSLTFPTELKIEASPPAYRMIRVYQIDGQDCQMVSLPTCSHLVRFLASRQPASRPLSPCKMTPREPAVGLSFETGTPCLDAPSAYREISSLPKYLVVDIPCLANVEFTDLLRNQFNLHPLNVEDVLSEKMEKVEVFERRGYLLCIVQVDEKTFVSVVLFRTLVLIVRGDLVPIVEDVLVRLTEQFEDKDRASSVLSPLLTYSIETGAKPATFSPAWALYALLDALVDSLMNSVRDLELEADYVDELLFIVSGTEQADVLRRIARTRSHLLFLRQQVSSKQHMVLHLSSANCSQLVTPHVQIFLRDVNDHLQWCNQRLDSAYEVLSQANSNYLSRNSFTAAISANRTNDLMKNLTIVASVLLPFNLLAGFFGMNVHVPFQDVPSLLPFYVIILAFFFVFFSLIVYFFARWLYRMEHDDSVI